MFKKDEEEFNKLHRPFAQPVDNISFQSPDKLARFVIICDSNSVATINSYRPSWVSPEKRSQVDEKRLTIGQYFKLKSADIRELSHSLNHSNVRSTP